VSAAQPLLQPERQPQYAPQQHRITQTTTGDGGGGGEGGGNGSGGGSSSPGGLAAELKSDGRLKNTLHCLVLVLPLAVLIFGEALQHRDSEIELPILKLELTVQSVLPVFLMVIAYMLHRAIRYARIVLWNIVYAPRQLTEASEIVLDNTEAYKMNSAYYDEVLDPMAAALATPVADGKLRWIGLVIASFNVVRSLVIYGVIFLILLFMALYVSQEVVSIVGSVHLGNVKFQLPADVPKAINNLILGLSVLLLLLAWSNAAVTLLVGAWGLVRGTVKLLLPVLAPLWWSFLFAPIRWMLRVFFAAGMRMRNWQRGRRFKKETAAYERRKQEFLLTSPAVAEFRFRLSLFNAVETLRDRLKTIKGDFSKFVTDLDNASLAMSLIRIGYCLDHLETLAERARLDFLRNDWRKFEEAAMQILDACEASPVETGSEAMPGQTMASEGQQEAAGERPTRSAAITLQKRPIDALFDALRMALSNEIRPEASFGNLVEISKDYFAQSELDGGGFEEPAPIADTSNTGAFARVLALLDRAGGPPSAIASEPASRASP
jgi:hypothetical protein